MKINRQQIRLLIFYDFKSNLSADQSLERFGLEYVSRATVYKWFAEFKRGRVELNDDVRSGHPVTTSGDDNVADVKRLVEADR